MHDQGQIGHKQMNKYKDDHPQQRQDQTAASSGGTEAQRVGVDPNREDDLIFGGICRKGGQMRCLVQADDRGCQREVVHMDGLMSLNIHGSPIQLILNPMVDSI